MVNKGRGISYVCVWNSEGVLGSLKKIEFITIFCNLNFAKQEKDCIFVSRN